MDQIKIGKFIAELRKEKNMTQQQLGDKIGISPLELLKKISRKDFNLCPVCGIGHLIRPSPT